MPISGLSGTGEGQVQRLIGFGPSFLQIEPAMQRMNRLAHMGTGNIRPDKIEQDQRRLELFIRFAPIQRLFELGRSISEEGQRRLIQGGDNSFQPGADKPWRAARGTMPFA